MQCILRSYASLINSLHLPIDLGKAPVLYYIVFQAYFNRVAEFPSRGETEFPSKEKKKGVVTEFMFNKQYTQVVVTICPPIGGGSPEADQQFPTRGQRCERDSKFEEPPHGLYPLPLEGIVSWSSLHIHFT